MAYALSQSTFESLLPSVVSIIQATQPPTTPAQKQELAKATMALRTRLATARDLVDTLPGGEMLLQHQQEVIAMLADTRDKRRAQLARLAQLSVGKS